jgi:hypothetical protein
VNGLYPNTLFPFSNLCISKEQNRRKWNCIFYTHTHTWCVCVLVYECVCVCVCVSRNTYSVTQMNTERVTQLLVNYVLFKNILQFCVKANFPTITAVDNFHHNPFMFPRWWIISSILCPSKSIQFTPCLFLPLTVLYAFSHLYYTPND